VPQLARRPVVRVQACSLDHLAESPADVGRVDAAALRAAGRGGGGASVRPRGRPAPPHRAGARRQPLKPVRLAAELSGRRFPRQDEGHTELASVIRFGVLN
jgi:hypothetical protein